MKIAIVGCAHGELDKIYAAVEYIQTKNDLKLDVLLCCGDFQAVRNYGDLSCMAVPPKYRKMMTFYKYYSGELNAPLLTLFIGGNHEASNYLSELPYGGWVAPNIYYLGLAGVVRLGNLRIAGISGIFKGQDYLRGHYERPPFSMDTIRSVYHVRNLEVFRMQQLKDSLIDVVLSHDWPRGIHAFGNEQKLLRRKPYFRQEANDNKLGSQPLRDILDKLTPSYWFSAHLHVKFSALYRKQTGDAEKSTKFLALDKCLPNRQYLQVLDLDNKDCTNFCNELSYDREWLAVLKSTDHLLNASNRVSYMPGPGVEGRFDFSPTVDELAEVDRLFDNNFTIPCNFRQTADIYTDDVATNNRTSPQFFSNPQTEEFCNKLQITNLNSILVGNRNQEVKNVASSSSFWKEPNPDEIVIDDDDEEISVAPVIKTSGNKWSYAPFRELDVKVANPDEIDLDGGDETLASSSAPVKINGDEISVQEFNVKFSSESKNPDEISIDDDDDNHEEKAPGSEALREKTESILTKFPKHPNVLRTDTSRDRRQLSSSITKIERKLKQLDRPFEFPSEPKKIIPRTSLIKPLIDVRRRYKNPLEKYLNVKKSRSSDV